MTQSKKCSSLTTLVTVAFLAVASLAGCGPESSAVATADRTFSVNGPVRLELQNGSGNSRVTVGSPGEVRVHAEFRVHAWPWDNPDRILRELVADPPVSQDANLIRIGRSGWAMNMVSAEYSVTVPPETEMHGMSGSGNLDVNGIAGPVSLTVGSGNISATGIANDTHAIVGSGDVTLTDTRGHLDVTSGSGDVRVRGANGEVRVRAGSGEIQIEQPAAGVVAQTGSGNIGLRDALGDVRLHTGSGDITVDGSPAPSSYWDIRASSGDVRLHVPASASFRLYARSSSGDFDITMPSAADQIHGRHEFQARIGDGKARVEIETSSGNISLR
jgi:putative adhesin